MAEDDTVKFANPLSVDHEAPDGSPAFDGEHGGEELFVQLEDVHPADLRHSRGNHKFAEALGVGVDPYVKVYLGEDGRKGAERTNSVAGNRANNHGRCPVWTVGHNNRLRLRPSPHDRELAIEVWDSDVYRDDLLGGRRLSLDEVRRMREGTWKDGRTEPHEDSDADGALANAVEAQIVYLQLFHAAGRTGRDAGMMQLVLRWGPGGELEIEPQACVDLLSDTPDIRDMNTFSDWHLVKIALAMFLTYMVFLTCYFYWFFSTYACGGPPVRCDVKTLSELTREQLFGTLVDNVTNAPQPLENVDIRGIYPALEGGGPFTDSLLFFFSIATTVGWGNQPVDLTQRYEGENLDAKALVSQNGVVGEFAHRHNDIIRYTKILLSISVLVEIVLIGVIIGALGASIRAFFRSRVHRQFQKALEQGKLDFASAPTSSEMDSHGHEGKTLMDRHPSILSTILLLLVTLIGTLAYAALEKECVDSSRTSFEERQLCFAEQPGEEDEHGNAKGWQHISTIDALYMTVISITTIGYGDYSPSTYGSKWFSIIYIPIAVAFTANAVDHFSQGIARYRTKTLERRVLDQFGGALAYSAKSEVIAKWRRELNTLDDELQDLEDQAEELEEEREELAELERQENELEEQARGLQRQSKELKDNAVPNSGSGAQATETSPTENADETNGARTPALTREDFIELQRSVNVDHTVPMTRNDFRLAVSQESGLPPSVLGWPWFVMRVYLLY